MLLSVTPVVTIDLFDIIGMLVTFAVIVFVFGSIIFYSIVEKMEDKKNKKMKEQEKSVKKAIDLKEKQEEYLNKSNVDHIEYE